MEDERGPSLLDAIKDFSENASPVDFVIIAQHWEMFLKGIGYTLLIYLVLTAVSDVGLRWLDRKYSVGVRRA